LEVIERFSEDVDIVLDRHALGFTGDQEPPNFAGTNKRNRKLDELTVQGSILDELQRYTTDFAMFTPFWFHGAPWEQEADFKERSPITYIQNVHTPLMLIEGESDFRTPPTGGGEQMFRALKYLRRPVVMVRFPGETHELSRSGKPTHRIERLQHIVAWFDKYLMGQDITPTTCSRIGRCLEADDGILLAQFASASGA
jgi:pimeloyl-ACP methyl ester carboxylesterase